MGNCSPTLCPAQVPHVVGLAGHELFRQQNQCEVNETCAEPLLNPMSSEVDREILILSTAPKFSSKALAQR